MHVYFGRGIEEVAEACGGGDKELVDTAGAGVHVGEDELVTATTAGVGAVLILECKSLDKLRKRTEKANILIVLATPATATIPPQNMKKGINKGGTNNDGTIATKAPRAKLIKSPIIALASNILSVTTTTSTSN